VPVVEQAKGILMAQHRCGPAEAFDLLRRVSRHANVKVRVLATRSVEQISSLTGGNWPETAASGYPGQWDHRRLC
jgi:hypothetical protein